MKNDREQYIHYSGVVVKKDNGYLWFADASKNGICRISLFDKKAEIVACFDNEDMMQSLLYCDFVMINGMIVFAPWTAENIACYDINNDEMEYISLKSLPSINNCKSIVKFMDIFSYEDNVYLVGCYYPAIVKLNIKTKKIGYLIEVVENIRGAISKDDNRGLFSKGHFILNGYVYLPIAYMPAILKLSLIDNIYEIIQLDCSLDGIGGMTIDDNNEVWLVGRGKVNDRLVKWNPFTYICREWKLSQLDGKDWEPFHAPIYINNKIILMPIYSKHIFIFHIHTEIIDKLSQLDSLIEHTSTSVFMWKTFGLMQIENSIIFTAGRDLKWYILDTNTLDCFPYVIDWQLVNEFYDSKMLYNSENIVLEKDISLERLINVLVGQKQ